MTAPRRLLEDCIDRRIEVPEHPLRIVSLVPSVTELLFDLGAGPRVAGVSRYCVEPPAGVASIPRVGGQKDPDLDAICALDPDLVIVVKEENHARDVTALTRRGVSVYVAEVKTVEAAICLIGEIGDLVDGEPARIEQVTREVKRGVVEARRIAAGHAPIPLFCPVWRDPWITISQDTYMFDLLTLAGGAPVLPGRPRSDQRYPKVGLEDVRASAPRFILLPDEPYSFGPADVVELAPLAPAFVLDGKLLGWYGRRTAGISTLASRIAEWGADRAR